jgi:hypothetical protein
MHSPQQGDGNPGSGFEKFYAEKIAPHRQFYAGSSRSSNQHALLALIASLIALGSFLIALPHKDSRIFMWIPAVFLLISIYLWYRYSVAERAFNSFFKEKIIGEILAFLLPGARLEPNAYIDRKYFKESALYRRIVESCDGNDLITAQYKGINFQASEMICTRSDSDSNHEVIFKGLFMKAPISGITGATYIWPANDIQLPVSLADQHYRYEPLHTVYRVETGAPAFDKYFVVYSSYPAEAAALLTQERMQGMVNLRTQLKKRVRFSFVPGRFYATVNNKTDLLEPVDSLDDKEYIKNYFYTILVYPAIINQLKLYEYI